MAVEFRVLGQVEAYVDGRRLDVGHARQRGVLVALLVDVNRPVSTDQLIDRVWADQPPYKARNALAAYISRLRQILDGAGSVRIVRGPGGYALTADAQSIDLHRFRRAVSHARTLVDSAAAAASFDAALDLWRGEPFATLDTPWAHDLRAALETERLAVTLDRNDALLAVGRHAELLGDLGAAMQRQPLDERVAGQLMQALYRSGRQAEALDVYLAMRVKLNFLVYGVIGADESSPMYTLAFFLDAFSRSVGITVILVLGLMKVTHGVKPSIAVDIGVFGLAIVGGLIMSNFADDLGVAGAIFYVVMNALTTLFLLYFAWRLWKVGERRVATAVVAVTAAAAAIAGIYDFGHIPGDDEHHTIFYILALTTWAFQMVVYYYGYRALHDSNERIATDRVLVR